jgi:type II secretory pathway pseudopilin PulG
MRKRMGTSLLELIITSALLMVVMAAVVGLFQSYSKLSRTSGMQDDYTNALQALEVVRNEIREASAILSPAVGGVGQSYLDLRRVDPAVNQAGVYSGTYRLPTIQPDPVGPTPAPWGWDPLDNYWLATVHYSMGGAPSRLQRTTTSAARGGPSSIPMAGPAIVGFSVDHPRAGYLVLHTTTVSKDQLISHDIPVTVDCEP